MREFTVTQADDLYELVTERTGKSLIITANRSASDWYSLFPNPVVAESILEEPGRFAATVLDPINRSGDETGARWTPEGVVAAPGFRDAYHQFAAGGWTQLGTDPEYGGQVVPQVLVTAVQAAT